MASALEIYAGSSSPAEAPRASASDVLFDAWDGRWTERNRQYQEAVNEYNVQKLLTLANWEREDSAYQRMVEDLKKAGINPYYALANGGLSLSGSSAASDVYTTKGKSSKKEKEDLNLRGLIATAIVLMKLLA